MSFVRAPTDLRVEVSSKGHVTPADRDHARARVARAVRVAPRPVVRATARLTLDTNPSLSRPAIVKLTADASGRLVRSHVAAALMPEAIDLAAHRLQRRLADLTSAGHSRAHHAGGEALLAERPEYHPLPTEERRVVRHKSPVLAPMDPERALLEMELLDYDFLLFSTSGNSGEAVVYRASHGESTRRLIPPPVRADGLANGLPADPPPTAMSLDGALELLDMSGKPFVFFIDDHTRRGTIAYRRYDGHYGLISPADEP